MPEYFCHQCTAVVYHEDEVCLECDTRRPQNSGWIALSDSMDPWLGRVLVGRYLLTKSIGQGASASVYRAESLAISRQFAIKIIHPSSSSKGPTPEQIAQRLEREIDALGRLRNPHVVRFYDVIELPLHHIGVVMDFVEGETIEQLVERKGPLPLARAISLLRQTANGIYEAHLAGMTHRDLKPENLMVERLPIGDEFVHILDFGIVYVDGSVGMTHGFIGTPLYASPEQALGEMIDYRSDIYSLGAIFFFMLTGRPPFEGTTVMQVLRQHVENVPSRISSLRKDNAPEGLEMLVRKMLAKEVNQRPEDLSEVILALDEIAFSVQDHNSSPNMARLTQISEVSVSSSIERVSEGSVTVIRPSIADSQEAMRTSQDRVSHTQNNFARSDDENHSLQEPTHPGLPGCHEVTFSSSEKISICAGGKDFRFAFLDSHGFQMHHLKNAKEVTHFAMDFSSEPHSMALGQTNALFGYANGTIEMLELSSGEQTTLFQSVFPNPVADVAIGPEDRLLLAAMESGRLYLSRADKDNKDWVRIRTAGGKVKSIAMSSRTDLYAVATDNDVIEISRLAEPKSIHMSIDVGQSVERMAFSEDSYLLGVLLSDRTFSIYQLINGKLLINFPLPQKGEVFDAFFSPKTNKIIGYLRLGRVLYAVDIQQTDTV